MSFNTVDACFFKQNIFNFKKTLKAQNLKSTTLESELPKEFLDLTAGGGEMAELIRQFDWSQSPVGPFEVWPQSLKTALSICLGSKFPMFVWWGRDLTVFYNDSYIPFTGLKHPRYLGRPAREQWAEIWEDLRPLTQQVLETGQATWAESMRLFMNRKGFLEETYFTFSYSPIRDESGGVGGIINPCQETTARILGERRLKTLHALGACEAKSEPEAGEVLARVLGENVYDIPFAMIYLSDAEGKMTNLIGSTGIKLNNSMHATVDLSLSSPDVWQMRQVNKTRHPQLIENLRSILGDELPNTPYAEGPDAAYVLPVLMPNQEKVAGFLILGISPRLAFDELYREFFVLICGHSTTQIVNLRTLEAEKRRAEELAELDQAKTAFFSNVSHEFRTPLTLMMGPIENVLHKNKEQLSPSVLSDMELVHRNSLRLLKLVNALLDFSRIEAKRVHAHYEPLDLAAHTGYLVSAFDSAIERVGMKLTVDCMPLPKPIYVDKDMWEKIVLNLMSNAFKYTLQGEITVSLRRVRGAAELRVRDTGVGIPKSELTKIFQRFHRVEGSKGRTLEGTGIGLALVKELVELHKGTIEVQSEPGQGSTFIVRIPEGTAHLPQDRIFEMASGVKSTFDQTEAFVNEALRWIPESVRPKVPSVEVSSATSVGSAKTSKHQIVVADDNMDMRNYLVKILSEYYDVTAVTNGQEAFAAIRAHRPNLLLSDIMMSIMDGVELLKKIRADEDLKTLPVVLLSARAGEEAVSKGVELGADDYLTKPFSTVELLARIQTHLNLAEMRNRMVSDLAFANKELDAFSYSVSHDLKAPLRAILGFVGILKEDFAQELSQKGVSYFERIEKAASQMSKLIEGLLELSRYNRLELQKSQVDLSLDATQIVETLRFADPFRNADVKIQPGVTAYGDPRLLEVVLENLLRNAWKFSRDANPSLIEFGAYSEPSSGETVYFVKDNGAGFDMAHVGHLFQTFERLHTSAEYEGTGVGLATVQRIITRHGGKIWAQGAVGQGAQFFFTL